MADVKLNKLEVNKISDNKPYFYSWYKSGTSFQLRLMPESFQI